MIRSGQFPPTTTTPPPTPVSTPADLSFTEFTDAWRTRGRATVRPAQRANDKARCKILGDLVVDGVRLADWRLGLVTADIIEAAFLQLTGKAHSTTNKYVVALRSLESWGLEHGYLTASWFTTRTKKTIKREEETSAKRDRRLEPDRVDEHGKILEPGEETRLMASATPWLQRLVIAALQTGCRRGELLSLVWGDVSADRSQLTIRASKAKSGKARRIPISPTLAAVLAMIENDPHGQPHLPTAHVFGDPIGGKIADPKKQWAKTCKAAGIVNLHFHDLRHEAGSRFLEAGWPLSEVQRMLGHQNIATTSTYLNSTDAHLQDSMRRLPPSPRVLLHRVARAENPSLSLVSNEPASSPAKALVN